MATKHPQSAVKDACNRLFALHADGFKRQRPTLRPVSAHASISARAEAIAPARRTPSPERASGASLF